MKILQVIHGYPMRYNAGSEVYTQTLSQALVARGHEVHVFTREEDPFGPDFRVRGETDADDDRIRLHVINNPRARDRYRQVGIDRAFAELLDRLVPDIVHIGHLNHLSTSLVREAAARAIPIVFTLHDFWLMCPRGQFMQSDPADPDELWPVCDGQDDAKCARHCYSRYFSGAPEEWSKDLEVWTDWVHRRMAHVREMVELVDLFLAPAHHLLNRFRDEFGIPPTKLRYLDYGFDRSRMQGRSRRPDEPFTFGYIGTHIPAKGIDLLLRAFADVPAPARLRIWGRPRGQETEALRRLADRLPADAAARVEWRSEYRNRDLVTDVFDHVDAIVVPSIWVENSPLVIHEAQEARIPVITADVGGMAEYVAHERNGLLFRHRDSTSLAEQMTRLAATPEWAVELGRRGYLGESDGRIPDVEDHAAAIESTYAELLARRDSARIVPTVGPWRITFDTNPDTCNLKCVMCEEHSPHSPLQIRRKQEGRPRRVMPIDLLTKVVAEAAGKGLREIIPSTMGEPLLYEDFDAILAVCEQYGVALNLTTNGTFPGRGVRAWAERLVPLCSDVKISINGANARTQAAIMIGSDFDAMIERVREFIAVRDRHAETGGRRCRVTFQVTFLTTNVDEFPHLVRLAIDLGVDRVKGHHLWAHFAEIESLSLRRSPETLARWNDAVAACRAIAQSRLLANGQRILLENFHPLEPGAVADLAPGGRCPFLGEEAWVSAAGRFDPCCAPDAQRRTLGEFGSLHDRSLLDIWTSDEYRFLQASYRNRGLCLSCNMRRPVEAS
jgi:glycosyltransferase involved in cell wall biosynthesis/MoaA/NifB/PqqE/SkfB family radical SAM enzyme